jgi:hypothetical protein
LTLLTQCADRIARLDPDRPPADVPLKRWLRLLTDARRLFDDGIVAQAGAAGWTGHACPPLTGPTFLK